MLNTYELMPRDSHKSFYGKAVVVIDGTSETLYSYRTPVMRRDRLTGEWTRLWRGWSATTGRRIAAFCGLNNQENMRSISASVFCRIASGSAPTRSSPSAQNSVASWIP